MKKVLAFSDRHSASWQRTINDFAWRKDYSRSIAVDIRYVLWVMQKYAGENYLLEEMGVE